MEFHSEIWHILEDDLRNIYSEIRCLIHGMYHIFIRIMHFRIYFIAKIMVCPVQKATLSGKFKFRIFTLKKIEIPEITLRIVPYSRIEFHVLVITMNFLYCC